MIDLRRLGYLVVLAKHLNYSRAAFEHGLTQSALSRAIQSLERDIGIRLFDRDQSGVRLTDQGRWVVAKAEVFLTHAADFNSELALAAKGTEGRISFGATQLAAQLLVPPLLSTRLADTPRFEHEVLIREVEQLYLMLAQGQIEFFICPELNSIWSIPSVMPVKVDTLGELPISLVVRKGHPLLSDGRDYADFPLLLSSTPSPSEKLPSLLRDRMDTRIQIIEDIGIVSFLVRETDATWLTCPFLVAEQIAEGTFVEIPLPNDIQARSFELFVYTIARRSRSPASQEFLTAFSKRIAGLRTTDERRRKQASGHAPSA